MPAECIRTAMREARYELMEDGRFFAVIPRCEGLWADGDTLERACGPLKDVLGDWILIKARHDDTFPVITGVDINPQPAYAEADQAAGSDSSLSRARLAKPGTGASTHGDALGRANRADSQPA